MTRQIDIAGIETALQNRSIPVARLCRAAGISTSTWHRLKTSARSPRESTCRVITAAFTSLIDRSGSPQATNPHPQQEAA